MALLAIVLVAGCARARAGVSRPTAASVMDGVRVLYNNDGENLVSDALGPHAVP